MHHFATACRSTKPAAPKTSAAATSEGDSVTGALMSGQKSAAFYAMQVSPPTCHEDLITYAAALRQDGPVTTIPLPHMVHSIHEGWLKAQAQPSPTHPLAIKVDREAYSTLNL